MIKKIILLLVAIIIIMACGNTKPEPNAEQKAAPVYHSKLLPEVRFNQKDLTIDGDLGTFKASWKSELVTDGVQLVTLTLNSPKATTPPEFALKWTTPSVDIHGFWTPKLSQDKSNYYNSYVKSRAVRYAPVVALYSNGLLNRLTFALSDTLQKVTIGTYLKEEDVNFHHYIEFFKEKTPATKKYSVTLRIDTRQQHYAQILSDVSHWWENLKNHTPAFVPRWARVPMYSTWYSFHQNITADEVVKQCKLSKALGFEAVIVDDGWQTLDSKRGYAFTGDWKPERIGDMKEFVGRVHQLGMKFLLWYSVPLVGEKSQNYKKFKGKYLWYWKGQGAYVLDPRYPEVRKFIIDTYVTAMQEWRLDGFKLDFMGMFRPDDKTLFTKTRGRDFASIDKAVDRLMTDIMKNLREVKGDILIEFRQPYIGPLMRKYGNMFRAADCPNMALVNRVRTTDIRLLSGNTAVHSDMFVWNDKEPLETAALQILNILFSVPQLSVKLDNFSKDHNVMIRFWTTYWKAKRHILLDGIFLPGNPQANYPVIRAERDTQTIIAVYNDQVIPLKAENFSHIDIVNAKHSGYVVLDLLDERGNVYLEVFDCMGKQKEGREIILKKGVIKLAVPPSGLIKLSAE
jgi:alpha-galactosidase